MENKIKNIIIIFNYSFLVIAMLANAILNIKDSITIMFLYLIILSSYSVRTYFVYNTYEDEKSKNYRKTALLLLVFTYLIEIFIVVILQNYDAYLISFIVLALIVEDIVVNSNYKVSLSAAMGTYIISCLIIYFKFIADSSHMVLNMLLFLPIYIVIFIIFSLINYLLKQNEIIKYSLKDITIKNIEKDNLYRNLKEAYSKVESITALRERNKIAAEIHDTVGHTLTTVLVELEASKRLMNKDLGKAYEKLNLAQGQVRKGLNDIRGSVRILERGEDILDFFNSLEALIEDTEKHSEVVIKRSIDKNIKISNEMREIIFAALMEGLSNGIRHGRSTSFIFTLNGDEDKIYFSLQDNGRGASVISPGFGLRAMKSRTLELKGTLDIISKEEEGFSLNLTFPLCKEELI